METKSHDVAPTASSDLEAEQAYIDYAYECLEAMKASAEQLRDAVIRESAGGTHQARFQRDVIVQTSLERLEQLDIGNASLCFGRIDHETGERYYIGRRAVSGPEQDAVVVDWRVPVAEPFYRATGLHPMGLNLRRHFATEGRKLLGIEDERFSDDPEDAELGLAGTGALVAALERARTGRMQDIVATVQKEQDEVIRADLPGVLVVQGGPGTGKTAVALHRAAYLLFTHRNQLERRGMLVVGPNRLFLRYIEQVLPALGESGVALTMPAGLFAGIRVTGADPAETARVKGDSRMAEVIANAIKRRRQPVAADITVNLNDRDLKINKQLSQSVISAAARVDATHNARRRNAEMLLSRRLHNSYSRAVGKSAARARGGPAGMSRTEVLKELRTEPGFIMALDRIWPLLTPQQLLNDLFGSHQLLRDSAEGILTEQERKALYRPAASNIKDIAWTVADVALLDEALMLLGALPSAPSEDEAEQDQDDEADTHRSYGHIVVDEAQDLSAMQLRMLARRAPSGSMTIVGDIAQSTGAAARNSWEEVLEHLPAPHGSRVTELSVNYRTPSEIMDLASLVLTAAAPGLEPPRSVRSTGDAPAFVEAGGDLPQAVAAAVNGLVAGLGKGTIAVIVPPEAMDEIARGLEDASIPFGDARSSGLQEQTTLISVDSVKGLEFDGVVVVEPARIVSSGHQGMRALYVALTRATQRLIIVHDEELPPQIRVTA